MPDDVDRMLDRMMERLAERQAAKGLLSTSPGGDLQTEQSRSQSQQVGDALAELAKRNFLQFLRLHRLAAFAAERCDRVVELKRIGAWLLAEQERTFRDKLGRLQQMHNALRAEHGLPPVVLVSLATTTGEWREEWCTLEYTGGGQTSVWLPDGMWERHDLNCTCPTLNALGNLVPKRFDCPVHHIGGVAGTPKECPTCHTAIAYNDGTDEWFHVDTWQHVCPEPYEGAAYPAKCICDGGSYETKEHPFLVNEACPLHGAPPAPVEDEGATYPPPGTAPGK